MYRGKIGIYIYSQTPSGLKALGNAFNLSKILSSYIQNRGSFSVLFSKYLLTTYLFMNGIGNQNTYRLRRGQKN